MQNKDLKKKLIEEGKDKEHRSGEYDLYKKGFSREQIEFINESKYGPESAKALKQLKNARQKQKAKIKDHLDYWIARNYSIFFLTFTFKTTDGISEAAMKKRVIRALKNFDDYIINIDYGSEKERVHFHVLAAVFWEQDGWTERIDYHYERIGEINKANGIKNKRQIYIKDEELEKYAERSGFTFAERVSTSEKARDKVSGYISKLISHGIKVKQTYISTKKGSEYQKYKKLIEKAKRINTKDNEESGKYISLQATIETSPELLEEFHQQDELKYIIAQTIGKREQLKREARRKYFYRKAKGTI